MFKVRIAPIANQTALVFSLLCLLLTDGFFAFAQGQIPQETVMTRTRPELDALGIYGGGLKILPALNYSALFDTNIFATQEGPKADVISIVSPQIAIQSGWRRHSLNFSGQADIGRYATFSSENFNDWQATMDGSLDIGGDMHFFASGGYSRLHEPRSSPDDAGGLTPTFFSAAEASAEYAQRLGKFHLRLDTNLERLDFDDVVALVNEELIMIDQDDRDRNEYSGSLRGGYAFVPEYEAFVQARLISRQYDKLETITSFDRSSNGYSVISGIRLNLTGLILGDIFVGYVNQNYKAPLPSISTPTFGVSLDWNLTRTTTVAVNLERDVEETTLSLFSAYISTSAKVTFYDEIARNWLVNASLGAQGDSYKGIEGGNQTDYWYLADVGITYSPNRYFNTTLTYGYQQVDGFATQRDFDKHIIALRLVGKL